MGSFLTEELLRIMTLGETWEIRVGDGMISCPISKRYVSLNVSCARLSDDKKSENFTPPNENMVKEFNISWDPSVHGVGGPVQRSWPVFAYPSLSMSTSTMIF